MEAFTGLLGKASAVDRACIAGSFDELNARRAQVLSTLHIKVSPSNDVDEPRADSPPAVWHLLAACLSVRQHTEAVYQLRYMC